MSMNDMIQPSGGPGAWTAVQMRDDTRWIHHFTAVERAELLQALHEAKAAGAVIPTLSVEDFSLPVLGPHLAQVRDELLNGRGFILLRGTPIEGLSDADASLMYWGIGAHLGRGVAQNASGDVLGHVTDVGRDPARDRLSRGYQSNNRLGFHVDASDLVALLCLRTALRGGRSHIVSSCAVHDAMLERSPELAKALYGEFFFDRRGEEVSGRDPYYVGPVFLRHDGRFYCRYNRRYIESTQNLANVPPLTPLQLAALDKMDQMCNDPEFRLDMELAPGDLQIVNNYSVLHSREAYEDHPEPERRRHLLRLWLRTGAYENLHASYRLRYSDMADWQRHPRAPSFEVHETQALAHG